MYRKYVQGQVRNETTQDVVLYTGEHRTFWKGIINRENETECYGIIVMS